MTVQHKDYIQELHDLRQKLKWLLKRETLEELLDLAEKIDNGYIDSYCRIIEQSEHGTNCGYAVKAKELFLKLAENDISAAIERLYKSFVQTR